MIFFHYLQFTQLYIICVTYNSLTFFLYLRNNKLSLFFIKFGEKHKVDVAEKGASVEQSEELARQIIMIMEH